MPVEKINTGFIIEKYTPERHKIVGAWLDSLKGLDRKIPDDDVLKKKLEKVIKDFQKDYDKHFAARQL